ncbi:peptidase [Streptomyces brevispora]|uniref:peptidase n=1 Tax=Streptomyces brevispora TaxID=887462 RepID=UPI003CC76BD0
MPPAPPEAPAPSAPVTGRPRHGLVLGLAAASVVPAVVLGGPASASAGPQRNPAAAPAAEPTGASASAPAAPPTSASAASARLAVTADQQPACGDPEAAEFPIGTRIHGGPDTYASGGGYGTWFLDLTNTTSQTCRSIHPVLVLTDDDRKLTSDQIQLKFSERAHPDVEHRVTWERTDRDEHIGVFGGVGDDSFAGFTVPAGQTVTVQVRLGFTSDTSPGRITANAAIVQRKLPANGTSDGGASPEGGDGEWVGESDSYPFTVVEDGTGEDRDSDGTGNETDGTRNRTDETGNETDGTRNRPDGTGEVGAGRETDGTGKRTDGTGTGEDGTGKRTDGTGTGSDGTGKGTDGTGTGTGNDGTGNGNDTEGTGSRTDGTGEVGAGRETDGTGRESDGTGKEPGRPLDGLLPGGARLSPRPSGAATGTPRPVAPGRDPAGVPELARTGISVPVPQPVLTVSGFLIGGGALVLRSRRMRRARR